MIIKTEIGFTGRYKFIRRKADETIVEETDWSGNHILNNMLDWLCGRNFGTATWAPNGCHVGTGNATPADADTSLQTFLAGTTTVQASSSSQNATERWSSVTTTFRFATGVAAGNISEVGIALGTTSNPPSTGSAGNSAQPLVSRALTVDGGGSPTTITVLSDEILDVVWELKKYAPSADITGTFSQEIDGVATDFTYTARPATTRNGTGGWDESRTGKIEPSLGTNGNMNNFGSGFGNGGMQATVFGILNNSNGFASSIALIGSYTNGNYYRDVRMSAALNNSNLATGINAFKWNLGVCGWMMEISPRVVKVATKEYYIDIRVTVGRYAP